MVRAFGMDMGNKDISRFTVLALTFFFGVVCFDRSAMAEKDLMAVVGDSISAGFIADTTSYKSSEADGVVELAEATLNPKGDGSLVTVNVDPIETQIQDEPDKQPFTWRLFFAQALNHKYTYSWASGDKVYSHYQRLKQYLSGKAPSLQLKIKNFAYSGGLSADLERQAEEIVKSSQAKDVDQVRYITLLIGANDVCSDIATGGINDDITANHIRGFFATLAKIKQDIPISVLISALPRIPDIGKPEMLSHILPSGKTCGQKLLEIDQLCNPLVSWSTQAQYDAAIHVVETKNALYRQLADDLNAKYPRQFRVFYSDKFYQQPIVIGRMAKDCFHPNQFGQQAISDILWKDQPWWHDVTDKRAASAL